MRKIRSFWTRLCAWVIGILGMGAAVSSCEEIEDIIGGGLCMYGTPNMDYQISGKVMDADSGKAIEGIQVSRPWDYGDNAVTTDKDGKFTISGNDFPNDTLHVVATDIDGEVNGIYAEEKVVVDLKAPKGKRTDAWYAGKYEAEDVKIKMQKASE